MVTDQSLCGYQQTPFASCPLAKGDSSYYDHLKYIKQFWASSP